MVNKENTNNFHDQPFGGVLGNAVIVRVVQELVADPDSVYSLSDMSKLTRASIPAVKDAVSKLQSIHFVENASRSTTRRSYRVNREMRPFIALTLLAYSITDENYGSSLMEDAMREYLNMQIEIQNTGSSSPSSYSESMVSSTSIPKFKSDVQNRPPAITA